MGGVDKVKIWRIHHAGLGFDSGHGQTSQLPLFHCDSETQGFWSILKVSLSYCQISL